MQDWWEHGQICKGLGRAGVSSSSISFLQVLVARQQRGARIVSKSEETRNLKFMVCRFVSPFCSYWSLTNGVQPTPDALLTTCVDNVIAGSVSGFQVRRVESWLVASQNLTVFPNIATRHWGILTFRHTIARCIKRPLPFKRQCLFGQHFGRRASPNSQGDIA